MTENTVQRYDAMTIANYIIEYSNENNYTVDNLRLQKLLYFVQCYSVSQNSGKIFKDSIKKWPYGPVVAEVYENFKSYGPNPITSPENEYVKIINKDDNFSVKIKKYDKNSILDEDRKRIELVIENLKKINTFRLVNITHQELSWSKYKKAILSGNKGLKYSIEELRQQFSK